MALPNLIGCGAPKSGSTTLYHYLSEHPDIRISPEKELNFFSPRCKKTFNSTKEYFNPQKVKK
ncbi:MAG: hypothetical protein GVY04_20145 [Cyanobacteria bacterium]|nr:hypothetical protein [Cyanobacteria bacterium GSL.Bin1]